MAEFKTGFNAIKAELAVTESDMEAVNARVSNYYETQYLKALNERLENKISLAFI